MAVTDYINKHKTQIKTYNGNVYENVYRLRQTYILPLPSMHHKSKIKQYEVVIYAVLGSNNAQSVG